MYKACIKYMYLSYCSVYIYVWFAILSFTNSHTAGLLRYLQNPNDIAAWFSVTTEVLWHPWKLKPVAIVVWSLFEEAVEHAYI